MVISRSKPAAGGPPPAPSTRAGPATRTATPAPAAATPSPAQVPERSARQEAAASPRAQQQLTGAPARHAPHRTVALGDLFPSARADRQPIRTWARRGADFKESPLPKRSGPAASDAVPRAAKVTETQLATAVTKGHTARLEALRSGGRPAAALAMPEDGGVIAHAYHLAVLGEDAVRGAFPLAMARIGMSEGFRVVVRADVDSTPWIREAIAKEGLTNVDVLEVDHPPRDYTKAQAPEMDFWSEDQGELHVDGSVSVPRSLEKSGGIGSERGTLAMYEARLARLHPEAATPLRTFEDARQAVVRFPDLQFSALGGVSQRNGQRAIAALASGGAAPLRVSNGYLEGGNTLVGRRADGTGYAVVGADSLAVSRAALEKDLGRKVADDELRALIAQDYGVAPKDLVVVEQPKDFHLDMHLMLLADGQVVVNDPLEAVKLERQWLAEDHEKSKPRPPGPDASARAREAYEDRVWEWENDGELARDLLDITAKRAAEQAPFLKTITEQLRAGGLTVHRMAGVFDDVGELPTMNFLNGEAAMNHERERFYVALGGDPRAEAYVVQQLGQVLPSGIERFHFLDRGLTGYTLNAHGGLSCRSKLEGALA